MKRVIASWVSLVLLLGVFAGCALSAPSAGPSATDAVATTGEKTDTSGLRAAVEANKGKNDDYEWPDAFLITCPNVGVQYSNLLGLTAILEKSTGVKARVVTNDVPPTRATMVRDRMVDMDLDTLGAYVFNMEGTSASAGQENGPFQIRIGYLGTIACRGYLVRGDSPIQTIYDIKPGMRIAEPPQPGIQQKNTALLAWIGLDYDDVEHVQFGNFDETLMAVADGRCDIVNTGFTGAAVMEFANNPKGVRVLNLPFEEDPEGAARWIAANPVESFGICDESSTSIPQAIGTGCIYQVYYQYWDDDADQDFVYHMTKWYAENWEDFRAQEPTLETMTIENFRASLDFTPYPVAEGAIRYMKEIGAWTEKDDARQARNIERIAQYEKAWQEARVLAAGQGITVAADNQAWIDLWTNHKNSLNLEHFTVNYD